MYSFVLQDWINLSGTGNIIQTEQDWLDLTPFQDIVAWVDVREVGGGFAPRLYLETAPSKDDILFVSMMVTPLTLSVAPNPTVIQLVMGSTAVPIAQFLRWRVRPERRCPPSFRVSRPDSTFPRTAT